MAKKNVSSRYVTRLFTLNERVFCELGVYVPVCIHDSTRTCYQVSCFFRFSGVVKSEVFEDYQKALNLYYYLIHN